MFDFVGKRKTFFSISVALIVLVGVLTLVIGPKLDIQFKGGSIATYSYTGELDKDQFEQVVEEQTQTKVTLQQQENTVTGQKSLVVTLSSNEGMGTEEQAALLDALQAAFPDNGISAEDVNNVDPVMGQEFLKKCVVAIVFASVIMIVYIGFRFRKIGGTSAGVVAVIALLHDVIIAYGAFLICGFAINDNFIAVVLTILGYSINDTIVIYDRIRENERYEKNMPLPELVNKSINQCLRRTITTSATTAAALLSICVVAQMANVTSIMTFAIPMMVGVLSGLYSSVFLSGPLWVWWQERKAQKAAQKAREEKFKKKA